MSQDGAEAARPRFRLPMAARVAEPRLERWAARLLTRLLEGIDAGCLTLELPSGTRLERRAAAGGPNATLILHRWRALARLLSRGDVGFAEGFMQGDWSSPDLLALLGWVTWNEAALQTAWGGISIARISDRLRHLTRGNTRKGSRRNIEAHYDLGNDFYAAWLDAGMNYSSGLYATPAQSLEAAQVAKLDRVAALLGVKPGDSVLEIGCGWGALAERLVTHHDCQVTGITLSTEQLAYAQRRLAHAGAKTSSILLQDYRDVTGRFDAIASIEMLEAAGEDYWPTYFATLRARLTPGGVAVLQVITIDASRFAEYRRRPDFIQRYVFPGGMLPTVEIVKEQLARAKLSLLSLELFGDSYALTLRAWRERYLRAQPSIAAPGPEAERFRRMWDYYLAYCETGFRSGALDVGLYKIIREADDPNPAG